jgi:transcriptional regulator with XRE-family HTH domain
MIMDPNGYDDELIELLAAGQLSHRQIAEGLGVDAKQVAAIARGSERPDLQERIEAASVEMLRQADRMARSYARTLLGAQLQEALKGEGEPARKAREFLLDRLLPKGTAAGARRDSDITGHGGLTLAGLTAKQLEDLADWHDGPAK